MQEEVVALLLAGAQLADNCLHQVQLSVEHNWVFDTEIEGRTEVHRLDRYLTIGPRAEASIGKSIDRRAQHATPVRGREGLYIRAPSGEAHAEGCFRPKCHASTP